MRGAAEDKKLAKIEKFQKTKVVPDDFGIKHTMFTYLFFHICHRFRVKSGPTDRDLVNYSKMI